MKKKTALLLAPGFEEIEASTPIDVLRRLGIEVYVLAIDALEVEGAHGLIVKADGLLQDHASDKWDALILPGGGPGAWNLKDSELVVETVRRCHAEGIIIGAICAAPIVLAKAGIIDGKNITAYPAGPVDEDIKAANNTGELVERDGNIITGKGPGAAMEFAYALGRALGVADDSLISMRKEMIVE